jgi:hypothetical protein
MISEMDRESLVALGARFHAARLVEQANRTLELASQDGRALDRLLPVGYVEEVRRVVKSLLGAIAFPAVAAGEAREVAESSSRELCSARSWRRKVARRAVRARALGRDVPDCLARVSEVDSGPAVATQLTTMVAWMEADPALLPGDDIDSLTKEGKALAARLGHGRMTEQSDRLARLPATDQRFCEEKGALFVGLRVINDAAHELHARDHGSSSRYNLSILGGRIVSERLKPLGTGAEDAL